MVNRVAWLKKWAFAAALLALSAVDAAARPITLAWDASPDTTVAGYRVYWSTQPGTYNDTDYFDVGKGLTWTGDLPGDQYYLSVRAYDADGHLGPLSLEVGDTAAFWLSNPGDQTSEAGQVVDVPLLAQGALVTYAAEGLPEGLDADALNGRIFGTLAMPAVSPAVQTVTARAVDAAGRVSSVQFYWTVRTNHAPAVAAPGDQTSLSGGAVTLPIVAVDPDGGSLHYTAARLPPGLAIDAATGIISGTLPPAAAGDFDVLVAVSDGRLVTSIAFTWRIWPRDALTVDVTASGEATGAEVTTLPFSTAVAGELLIVFVEAAQPTTAGAQTAIVSGAGLQWSLVARANGQPGTAEIWSARAAETLSDATVTANVSVGGTFLSLTVVGIAGADGVGASAAVSAASGAPAVALTTTRAGSFVFGAGNDWDGATARTLAAGQELVNEAFSDAGDTFWVQRVSGAVAVAGTPVTIDDTAPTTDRWNLAAVEILAAGPAIPLPGSLSIDDPSVSEGGVSSSAMTFTVTLSAATSVPVSVRYATADGTAKAGSDYAARSGTLVFAPGTTKQTIVVTILGDAVVEPDESFSLVLTNPTNAVLADSAGRGTILNDDSAQVDGQMAGFGALATGRLRDRFVFRVSERQTREYARLEFWSSEPVKGKGVDDDDRRGHEDRDYGHDHRPAKNRFEATAVASVVFGPREQTNQSVMFAGTGQWNGKAGFTFEARAADRGEPGRGRDTFALIVKDSRGTVVLNVSATIEEGNIQSTAVGKR
jgi:hypothetical protein